jgi:hypothetical protein
MARHKHADVIHAWADGADIQYLRLDGVWEDDSDTPEWFEDAEYRIKPKIVKREGWVNIYRTPGGGDSRIAYFVYATEEAVKMFAGDSVVATAKIEWEEEE